MIYAKDLKKVGQDPNSSTIIYWGDLEVDSAADFSDISTYFPNSAFIMSSRAHSISDNKKYMLDSSGNWVEQEDTPFSNVYTKSEVDGLLLPITDDIQTLYTSDSTINSQLAVLINEGCKNVVNWSATSSTIEGVTFTINPADRTVSTSGTANQRSQKPLNFTVPPTLQSGSYVLTGCPAGGAVGTTVKYCLYVWDVTTSTRVSMNDTGSGVTFDWTPDSTHQYNIGVDIRSGNNADGLVFRPMITEVWKYALTQTYVPYSPSNAELAKMILGY